MPMSTPPITPVRSPQSANSKRRTSVYQTPRSVSSPFAGVPDSSPFDQTPLSTGSRKRAWSGNTLSYHETPLTHGDHSSNLPSPLAEKSLIQRYDNSRSKDVVTSMSMNSTSVNLGQTTASNPGIQFRRTWHAEPTANDNRNNENHNHEYTDVTGATQAMTVGERGRTWSGLVFNLVGGVAGKMWEFCRTNAFGGFTAGGGTSYEITENAPKLIPGSWTSGDHGLLAESGPSSGSNDKKEPNALEQRPAKRLHGGAGWVMVDHRSDSPAFGRPATPSSSHISYLPRPVNPPSIAQPRRSSNRISSTVHGSPIAPRSRPSASFASPRSPEYSSRLPGGGSPVSVDVQNFTAKRRREEYETDASIWRLNQQLADMIRQGQDALASKVDAGSLEFKD